MRILIVGVGVIGSTYGHLFNVAGHDVEHIIREGSKNVSTSELKIKLLDGRTNPKGEVKEGIYKIKTSKENKIYDFIFVSVPEGGIRGVLTTLKEKNIQGTIILSCGIWEEHSKIKELMNGWDYILGYPVAGGNIKDSTLNCCVFDHFMLEGKEKSSIKNYDLLKGLFSECNINIEVPYDMLEWIWIHMAINAGVITVAGKYRDIKDTSAAAEEMMGSSKLLSEAVISIRETTKIIESRGVCLKKYNNELLPYKIHSKVAGYIMKKMFSGNILTRRIMTLHNNMEDLLFVCRQVYEMGTSNKVSAPVFYENYKNVQYKIKNKRG